MSVDAVQEPSTVQDAYAPNQRPVRRRTSFPHNSSTFHRGFQATCGRRGKQGPARRAMTGVFQNSSIAQPGFRKPRSSSTPAASISSEEFPLFLPHYGDYCLFLSLLTPFSYPSHPARLQGPRPSSNRIAGSASPMQTHAAKPNIPCTLDCCPEFRYVSCFPPSP